MISLLVIERVVGGLVEQGQGKYVEIGRGWITPTAGRFIDFGATSYSVGGVHDPYKVVLDLWEHQGELAEAEAWLWDWFVKRAGQSPPVGKEGTSRDYLEWVYQSIGIAPWHEEFNEIWDCGYMRVARNGIELHLDPDEEPTPKAIETFVSLLIRNRAKSDDIVFVDNAQDPGRITRWAYVEEIWNVHDFQHLIGALHQD